MPPTVTQIAKQIRDALIASATLKPLTDDLYAQLGSFTVAQVIDTGAGGQVLIALPGYGPLDDPKNFVFVGTMA